MEETTKHRLYNVVQPPTIEASSHKGLMLEHARRYGRVALAALQLTGGLALGSLLASHFSCVDAELGPQPVEVCTRVDLDDPVHGGLDVDGGLVGGVRVPNTHTGPVKIHLQAKAFNTNSQEIDDLKAHPERARKVISALGENIEQDLQGEVRRSLERAGVLFLLGNLVVWGSVPLASYLQNPERKHVGRVSKGLAVGTAVGAGSLAVVGGLMWSSRARDPLATLEPYGPVAEIIAAAGDVGTTWQNYKNFSGELAQKAQSAQTLQDTATNLEVINKRDTLKVMVISDIHCNVGVYRSLHTVAKQAGVELIIDAGDDTDYGTSLENACLDPLSRFRDNKGKAIRVLWAKGVHEGPDSEAYARTLPHVTVLDGQVVKVKGLKIIGLGDPNYTETSPDANKAPDSPVMRAYGSNLQYMAETKEAQVVVLHNPTIAVQIAQNHTGTVGTVIAGHSHVRSGIVVNNTNVHVEGTSGAGGPKAIANGVNEPINYSILYLDKTTGRIVDGDLYSIKAFGAEEVSVNVGPIPRILRYARSQGGKNASNTPVTTTSVSP